MSVRDSPLRLALMDVLSFAATPEDILNSILLTQWSELDSKALDVAWWFAYTSRWVRRGSRWHRVTPKGLAALHRMVKEAA